VAAFIGDSRTQWQVSRPILILQTGLANWLGSTGMGISHSMRALWTSALVLAGAQLPLHLAIADETAFRDGHADRQRWEAWFAGLSGASREGAEFWASHRSDRTSPGCASTNDVAFRAGCEAAEKRLNESDRRRHGDADYKAGWNSPNDVGAGSTTFAGPVQPSAPTADNPAVARTWWSGAAGEQLLVKDDSLGIQINFRQEGGYAVFDAITPANFEITIYVNKSRNRQWGSARRGDDYSTDYAYGAGQAPDGHRYDNIVCGQYILAGGDKAPELPGVTSFCGKFPTRALTQVFPDRPGWKRRRFEIPSDEVLDTQHPSTPPSGELMFSAYGGGPEKYYGSATVPFVVVFAPSTGTPTAPVPPGGNSSATIAQQTGMLMQPGLWAVNTTQTIGGRTMNSSGSRCLTPEMVAQITGGNGELLLNNPMGGGCQLQQQLVGNKIVAGGQCNTGNAVIQMSARITFDSPQHLVGQASWNGTTSAQQLNISSFFEGRLIGGC
jgi:hypothetical protein